MQSALRHSVLSTMSLKSVTFVQQLCCTSATIFQCRTGISFRYVWEEHLQNDPFCVKWEHTHNHFTALDFARDNSDELVPEETFTHSHLSWSSVIPYLLPPSIMIHCILARVAIRSVLAYTVCCKTFHNSACLFHSRVNNFIASECYIQICCHKVEKSTEREPEC